MNCYLEPNERADGSESDVEVIRKKGIAFVSTKIDSALPFGDKKSDFVYAHHVVEHLADPATVCREKMCIGRVGAIMTPLF